MMRHGHAVGAVPPGRGARPSACDTAAVFILYAVIAGLVIGVLTGGRLSRLGELRIRWLPLALVGLGIQVVLFSDLGASLAGDLSPLVYVASTILVLAVVLANLRIPGLALIAVGASLNLIAIVANGGSMPADPDALASLGKPIEGAANSVVLDDPALPFLTDILAMPTWLPLANVFSIGDVLIGVGVAVAIVAGMRGRTGRSVGSSQPGLESP